MQSLFSFLSDPFNSTLALSRTVSHAFGLVARFALIATLEKRVKKGFLRSERVF